MSGSFRCVVASDFALRTWVLVVFVDFTPSRSFVD